MDSISYRSQKLNVSDDILSLFSVLPTVSLKYSVLFCSAWTPFREDAWKVEAVLHSFLRVVSFTLRKLYPRAKIPDKRWTGDCVDPSSRLDMVAKRRILTLTGNITPEVRPVGSHFTDRAFSALSVFLPQYTVFLWTKHKNILKIKN
jgi:hypothetical protein